MAATSPQGSSSLEAKQQRGCARLRRRVQKTKLCWFFRRGSCAGQDTCPFVHDEEERRSMPQNPSQSPCWHWSRGYCRMGNECKFVHVGQPGSAVEQNGAQFEDFGVAGGSPSSGASNPFAYFGGYGTTDPTMYGVGYGSFGVPPVGFGGAPLGVDPLSSGFSTQVLVTPGIGSDAPLATVPSGWPAAAAEAGFASSEGHATRCASPANAGSASSSNASEAEVRSEVSASPKRCDSPASVDSSSTRFAGGWPSDASSNNKRCTSPSSVASSSTREAGWQSDRSSSKHRCTSLTSEASSQSKKASTAEPTPTPNAGRVLATSRTPPWRRNRRQASPPRVSTASVDMPTSPVIGAYEGWVLNQEDSASCPLVQLGDAWALTVKHTFVHVSEADDAVVASSSRKRAASASA
eukprot:TRINITY_DN8142_c0_g1_i1.p1 TRINITY_DN8142_c0_g1~~TRINITY_DN8142_c0_g1_i1.p1  ORF type:complete len:408 (-),score=69.82 TRINITY_DN8142_c0_g1_i1:68-1291(-)